MSLESISIENPSKELAYLFGVYLTDASITSRIKPTKNCTFQLQVIDKDFASFTLQCLKKILPNCNGNVNKYDQEGSGFNSGNQITKYCVGVGFTKYKDYFESQTSKKHHIPYFIWDADLSIKKWFIAGIMDGDGYISLVYKNRINPRVTIGIGKGTDGWIWEFKKFLEKLKIRINKPEIMPPDYTKNGSVTMVRFKINARDFINNGLFFTIERKQKKLKKAIEILKDVQKRNY